MILGLLNLVCRIYFVPRIRALRDFEGLSCLAQRAVLTHLEAVEHMIGPARDSRRSQAVERA